MTQVLDGTALAKQIRTEIKERISATKARFPRFSPHLAIIQQGSRSDSNTYIKMKIQAGVEAGVKTTVLILEENATEDEVMAEVERLNEDDTVHGLLVQLPLNPSIGIAGERRITEAVSPNKDVDG